MPGCGPVAFGALPFLPGAPGELVVPAVVVGKAADGTRWITSIDGAEADLGPVAEPAAARRAAPSPCDPGFDPDRFQAAVVPAATRCGPGG